MTENFQVDNLLFENSILTGEILTFLSTKYKFIHLKVRYGVVQNIYLHSLILGQKMFIWGMVYLVTMEKEVTSQKMVRTQKQISE